MELASLKDGVTFSQASHYVNGKGMSVLTVSSVLSNLSRLSLLKYSGKPHDRVYRITPEGKAILSKKLVLPPIKRSHKKKMKAMVGNTTIPSNVKVQYCQGAPMYRWVDPAEFKGGEFMADWKRKRS